MNTPRATALAVVLLLICCSFSTDSQGQDLKRRANLGGAISYLPAKKWGVVSNFLTPGSDLLRQGVNKGDTIQLIDGNQVSTTIEWDRWVASLREGDKVTFTIKRGEQVLTLPVSFTALPKESWPGLTTEYGTVAVGARKARTLITYPAAAAKAPAMIILGGLSCNSMELSGLPRESGWALLLKDLVTRSNMVVLRIEKWGVGDSEGVCADTDFTTELELFRQAIRSLFRHPRVDSAKVVLFGSSMGSMQAALLANELPVKAVAASGTFLKSWYEHMLEIERRTMEMSGIAPSAIQDRMSRFVELYYQALVNGKSFGELIREKPALQEVNYHGAAHMYGRPLAYYQQLQQINIPHYWEGLKVPVLLHYGKNDWIMTEEDNDLLVQLLKSKGITHRYLPVEGMDHNYFVFPNREDSFKNYWTAGKWDNTFTTPILEWLQSAVQ